MHDSTGHHDIISERLIRTLDHMRPLTHDRAADYTAASRSDFRFVIDIAPAPPTASVLGAATITVTDPEGKPCTPDLYNVSPQEAGVLAAINDLTRHSGFSAGWHTGDNRIDLRANPRLLALLFECDNVVDADGHRIGAAPLPAALRIDLQKNDDTYRPSLRIADPDTPDIYHPVIPDTLLSSTFLLHCHTLRRIADIGSNYIYLPAFLAPVPADAIAAYISLVASYFDNITICIDGIPVPVSRTPVTVSPTIVFEKVDTDRALYLRVTDSIPGSPLGIDFPKPLTAIAIEGVDGIIRIHPVASGASDIRSAAEHLRSTIASFAPTRTYAREIYHDNDGFFIIPQKIASPFLLQGLPALLREFHLVGAEKLRDYRILASRPRLSLHISSGIDYLDVNADIEIAGTQMPVTDLLAQYASDRYITLSDGNRVILDENYMQRMQRIFRVSGKGSGTPLKVSFFDLPEIETLLDGPLEADAVHRHRTLIEGFNQLRDRTLRLPHLQAQLRPYQTEGVKWISYLYSHGMGGCLADDMGLGKTVQAIAMLTLLYPDRGNSGTSRRGRPPKLTMPEIKPASLPSLIVMPKSLIFNWEAELRRFAPHISFHTYYGSQRTLDTALKAQIVLTTYATVRNDIDSLRRVRWEYVVLDESQNIKNLASLTTKSVMLLNSSHRLALSGTPLENNITEIYSLFRFLNPAMFGNFSDFRRFYLNPIQRDNDRQALDMLRRKIFPFILRRLKRDVLTDLPERTQQVIYTEMEPAQRALYDQRRLHYIQSIRSSMTSDPQSESRMMIFQAMSELRRIASVPESLTDGHIASPKIEPLMENLIQAVSNGHKTVVFFNYIAGIELVGEQLKSLGIVYDTITGATGDRASVVTRFQSDPQCMVLLMTLKTGGVGINLTVADTVFIFEPWWNRAAEQQAVDRLHRIGQKQCVSSYSLIVRDSIEEKILILQQKKSTLFDSLISSDPSMSKSLSDDDIQFLLS